jgi:hypothetical protein
MPKYENVDWSKGACFGMPTTLFYAFEESRDVQRVLSTDVFRNICLACPIWKDCLTYAFSYENYGIWGGTTTHERNALKQGVFTSLVQKVVDDFAERGITFEELLEALREYSNHERSVAHTITDKRKNGVVSNSRPRE